MEPIAWITKYINDPATKSCFYGMFANIFQNLDSNRLYYFATGIQQDLGFTLLKKYIGFNCKSVAAL